MIATARSKNHIKNPTWNNDVSFIECDIHKDTRILQKLGDINIIHLAWEGLSNYDSDHHIEQNLPDSLEFLKSMISNGTNQILVAGTCFEYGHQCGEIRSSAQAQPITKYAQAKDRLRKELINYQKINDFKLQWARLFYVFGDGQSPSSILSQLDAAIDRNEPLFNMSHGEQLRDYLPIEMVAQQLFDLYEGRKSGVFNVCSGTPISIRQLVERRIAERNSSIIPNFGYYAYRAYEPKEFWGKRDIGETMYLPALPNAPIRKTGKSQELAPIRLRLNSSLNFLENEAFAPEYIDYSKEYENTQEFSPKFQKHMKDVLEILKINIKKDGLLVEVGCGQGAFVEMVDADGYFKIKGYDKSYDGSNRLIEKRYLSHSDRITADAVILRHVLEHIPDPFQFLVMLKDVFYDAKIFIEVPDYEWIVKNQAFFDITFEHVNYFSEKSLKSLFLPENSTHGVLFDEQYQFIFSDLLSLNPEFQKLYKSDHWRYMQFECLFPRVRSSIGHIDQKSQKSIFLWGAATKGCLFLAHCKRVGMLLDRVKFAIDQNPKKVGKFLPGSFIEIKAKEDFFAAAKPGDLLIISNPAYKNEIIEQVIGAGLEDIKIHVL